ncbi:MAG: glycosyltransferase [Actinomycetota bacterium]
MTLPEPSLRHLLRMTDDTSLFEHAIGSLPNRSLGYCSDDAGRALAVLVRSDQADAEPLAERMLEFLVQAHEGDGRFRLRMGFDRRWTADPSSDDACGRAIFGLGVAAASAPWAHVRREARRLFESAGAFRSPFPRATAHAAVGAAELFLVDPSCAPARSMVDDALGSLPHGSNDERWPWPEPRLAYGNALLPEALIATGHAAGKDAAVEEGLRLLRWLVGGEVSDEHLSLTPAAGRGPDEAGPGFDQQPIEAGVLADACARAFDVTNDIAWLETVRLCVDWFEDRNDVGVPMLDEQTGGAFDGLHPDGVNQNQGAESAIALLTTLQQAFRLEAVSSGRVQRTASSAANS